MTAESVATLTAAAIPRLIFGRRARRRAAQHSAVTRIGQNQRIDGAGRYHSPPLDAGGAPGHRHRHAPRADIARASVSLRDGERMQTVLVPAITVTVRYAAPDWGRARHRAGGRHLRPRRIQVGGGRLLVHPHAIRDEAQVGLPTQTGDDNDEARRRPQPELLIAVDNLGLESSWHMPDPGEGAGGHGSAETSVSGGACGCDAGQSTERERQRDDSTLSYASGSSRCAYGGGALISPSTSGGPSITPVKLVLVVLAAALVAAGASAAPAFADGDPASDILLGSTVFLPQDANIPQQGQAELLAITKVARAQGVPVRVAIISSKFDLGSVPELFGKPQQYAQFLAAEIAFVYRGRLVVVMPNGLGVYWTKHSSHFPGADATRNLVPAAGGAGLAAAGSAATQKLALAAGRALKTPSAAPAGASPGAVSHGGSNSTTWIVLGVGLALIAITAAVSIRLRPLWRKSESRRRG